MNIFLALFQMVTSCSFFAAGISPAIVDRRPCSRFAQTEDVEIFSETLLTGHEPPCSSRLMTQRNIQSQTLKATSPDVPVALSKSIIAALVLVLVLITVQTGAGVGFA